MVSLTVVILTFALIFASVYLIYKMNKPQLKPSRHHHKRHHHKHSP